VCGIYQISYGKLELEPNHIWDKLSGGLFPKRRDFLLGFKGLRCTGSRDTLW